MGTFYACRGYFDIKMGPTGLPHLCGEIKIKRPINCYPLETRRKGLEVCPE